MPPTSATSIGWSKKGSDMPPPTSATGEAATKPEAGGASPCKLAPAGEPAATRPEVVEGASPCKLALAGEPTATKHTTTGEACRRASTELQGRALPRECAASLQRRTSPGKMPRQAMGTGSAGKSPVTELFNATQPHN